MECQAITNCIIYIGIALVLYKVLTTEKADIMCPMGPNTKDKSLCREGNGKTYYGSLPENKDKTFTLLKKIQIAAKSARKDVTWRRAFIIACIGCVCIFTLVLKRFPTGSETILTIFILTTIIYFAHSLYNYHHYRHSEENIVSAIDILLNRQTQSSVGNSKS